MQSYAKRILCMHDISAVGRCSMSVINPVITALGEECAMLPTALLSTHTGGFGDVAALSSGDFALRAISHYKRAHVSFDAVYSGYLGTAGAANAVLAAHGLCANALKVVDPVCADNGRVYSSVNGEILMALKQLASGADVITPNVTEAKILLAQRYEFATLTEKQAEDMCAELAEKYCRKGVVTSVLTDSGFCNAVYDEDGCEIVPFEQVKPSYPGTGDMFAALLTAIYVRGDVPFRDAAKYAARTASAAVKVTAALPREPKYGLAIELLMPRLCALKEFLDEHKEG